MLGEVQETGPKLMLEDIAISSEPEYDHRVDHYRHNLHLRAVFQAVHTDNVPNLKLECVHVRSTI